MKPFQVTLIAAVAICSLLAGAALGNGTMAILPPSHGAIVSQTEGDLMVTVECAIHNQTDGAVTVTLAQTSGSKTTKATGTTAVVCDGQARAYPVAVTATSGRWHNGSATLSATGSAAGYTTVEACYIDSDGVQHCAIGYSAEHDTGAVGPVSLTLENG